MSRDAALPALSPATLDNGLPGSWRKGTAETEEIAYASAKEVDSHLRLLAAASAVNGTGAERVLQGFDEVRAMIWRLLHPM